MTEIDDNLSDYLKRIERIDSSGMDFSFGFVYNIETNNK